MFSYKVFEISKNVFFIEHLPVAVFAVFTLEYSKNAKQI